MGRARSRLLGRTRRSPKKSAKGCLPSVRSCLLSGAPSATTNAATNRWKAVLRLASESFEKLRRPLRTAPSFVLPYGVENRYLEQWNRFGLAMDVTATAGNQSTF